MLCCKYLILEGGEKLGSFTAVKHTTLNGVGILITSIDTFIHFQMGDLSCNLHCFKYSITNGDGIFENSPRSREPAPIPLGSEMFVVKS